MPCLARSERASLSASVRGIVIAACSFGDKHQQLIFGFGDLLNEGREFGSADTFADAMQVQLNPATQHFGSRLL
jgi:hypothetical protein